MDMQMDLFGGSTTVQGLATADPPRCGEYRYYFTLVPPPSQAQDIERGAMLLARRFGARYPIRADRQHVSLNGIWRDHHDVANELLDEAIEIGAGIRRPGFDIVFDTVQTWAGSSPSKTGGRTIVPTVLACSNGARDAQTLHADIRRDMQRAGMAVGPARLSPHLTIWYGPQRVPDIVLKRPFRWAVRKFWLVHTAPGMKRPDYIGEWPLG